MVRPRLLDLCCGAGGATRGYQLAGFHVTGVDLHAHPDYCGDEFHRADAVEFLRAHGRAFDVIAGSPPCQRHTTLIKGTQAATAHRWSDIIADLRAALADVGRPWVLENVPSAPLRADLTLCGEMFGLAVIRHRRFEFGYLPAPPQPAHKRHRGRVQGWRYGEYFAGPYFAVHGDGGGKGSIADWQQAMGMPWVGDRRGLAEAIPPAYARHVGEYVLRAVHLLAS